MELNIQWMIYKINTVGNMNRGFTDLNASGRGLILRSVITMADDNMQDKRFMYRRVRLN